MQTSSRLKFDAQYCFKDQSVSSKVTWETFDIWYLPREILLKSHFFFKIMNAVHK